MERPACKEGRGRRVVGRRGEDASTQGALPWYQPAGALWSTTLITSYSLSACTMTRGTEWSSKWMARAYTRHASSASSLPR